MTLHSEPQRAALRAVHKVRLVTSAQEGTAAADLPPGVYGFSGSPGLAAPLFAERRYRNFEIHHLHDGNIVIVGFVTAVDATNLRAGPDPVVVMIYPDIETDASEIVAVPYSRIVHHRQYSVRNAPGLQAQVLPEAAVTL